MNGYFKGIFRKLQDIAGYLLANGITIVQIIDAFLGNEKVICSIRLKELKT
jgi:hypothetical protein